MSAEPIYSEYDERRRRHLEIQPKLHLLVVARRKYQKALYQNLGRLGLKKDWNPRNDKPVWLPEDLRNQSIKDARQWQLSAKETEEEIGNLVHLHPFWEDELMHPMGVKELSLALIIAPTDFSRTIAQMKCHLGMAATRNRPEKHKKLPYVADAKVGLVSMVGLNLIRKGNAYRPDFEKYKARLYAENRLADMKKGRAARIDNMAKRYVVVKCVTRILKRGQKILGY